ncbi:protein-disulfide reductase DsbD [Aliikangiella maris]|uniref:Protein-disulfide reductase DsbD n=2 Tax=Aliikangiella maris TaxID=3162458 RepID=A0ABV2BZF7_9GAMM
MMKPVNPQKAANPSILALFLMLLSFFSSPFTSLQAEEADLSQLFAAQSDFLKVDDAFKLDTEIIDNEIIARFTIAQEYYMYRSRFAFSANGATLGEAYIPAGKKKVDEYLGNVEVYYRHVEISIPFKAHQNEFDFNITFQGCAEAGLCYPPEEKQLKLFAANIVPKVEKGVTTAAVNQTKVEQANSQSVLVKKNTLNSENDEVFVPEQEKVVNFLTDKSLIEIIFYFILLGIGLAFTPCVLPMVPILSSIIVGQGKDATTQRSFSLSLVYTQSMAIPYAIMGIIVGMLGGSLSNTLQQPIFILVAAFIFVLLSFSMFGFYELQLPSSLQNKLNQISNSQKGGSYWGAGVMGFLSALVVSPCVTVPLAGVLIYITQTGDSVIGGVALYSLAVGMGIPLLLVGVGGHKLLPKSGQWMNAVKAAFGVGMLGMALYISKHLIPGPIYLLAWSILLIVSSIYLGALSAVTTNIQKFWKGIGLVLFIYGIILIIGASLGNGRLLAPLENINVAGLSSNSATTHLNATASSSIHDRFISVKTIEDVQMQIKNANAQGQSVMLDFFAESCTACYEFAEKTFPDPRVEVALKNSVLIQADVTANDAADKALMAHYDVRGLPSILFFDKQGQEEPRLRAIGFEKADVFVQRINAAFK